MPFDKMGPDDSVSESESEMDFRVAEPDRHNRTGNPYNEAEDLTM